MSRWSIPVLILAAGLAVLACSEEQDQALTAPEDASLLICPECVLPPPDTGGGGGGGGGGTTVDTSTADPRFPVSLYGPNKVYSESQVTLRAAASGGRAPYTYIFFAELFYPDGYVTRMKIQEGPDSIAYFVIRSDVEVAQMTVQAQESGSPYRTGLGYLQILGPQAFNSPGTITSLCHTPDYAPFKDFEEDANGDYHYKGHYIRDCNGVKQWGDPLVPGDTLP